mmetsp:Transcript_8248/g.12970  ORF Transcript_8248/g.12970 Transcript_8248/m.12970 type:complete len:296 (+) Transcript_8248:132-1019(+)
MPAVDFKALFIEERERRRKQQQQSEQEAAGGSATPHSNVAAKDSHHTKSAEAPPCVLAPRRPLVLTDFEIAKQFGVRGLHYIPDFITEEEEQSILQGVYADGTEQRWVQCGNRRVQNWGGKPGDAMVTEDLPPFAAALVDAVITSGVCDENTSPNHVLVNEYNQPAGITPHNDGALYAPHVAIVTLSGSALMDFWPTEGPAVEDDSNDPEAPQPLTQVMLRPRSLLLYQGGAYGLRHGIRNAAVDQVSARCANVDDLIGGGAYVNIGDAVARGARRQSVVFVRKGLNHASLPASD